MSLKDDFLEALRSVKRDFFRETEYNGPTPSPGPDQEREGMEAATGNSHGGGAVPQQPVYDATPEPPSGASPGYSSRHQPDDDVVFEAFRQASAVDDNDDTYDDIPGNLHTGDAYEESFGGSGAAHFYRSFDPNGTSGGADDAGGGGGRKIMDMDDGTGIYGDDKTIISKNTVIRGALQTDDSVRLLGQVLGDIECKSNIVVAGKVRGNTSAANAYIFDAQVDGDVRCDDIINISNDAWILGNIRAQQAEINGKVKGNIEIRHTVCIGSSSSVLGDISTDELEIKRGAFINGQVMMYTPSRDVLDRFDRFND